MKISTYSYRRGHTALAHCGKPVLAFLGMLTGTAEANEDIFAVAAHWHKFLRQHGWRERKSPLRTNGFLKDQFLVYRRACISLSLAHGDQVGHVLLAFQGLYQHEKIRVGILCVHGMDTLARVRADLSWLRQVITVPTWVIALK